MSEDLNTQSEPQKSGTIQENIGVPFQGAVSLIDYHGDIDGSQYRVYVGQVRIHEAVGLLGFRTGSTEANWIATVEGFSDQYIFPGCKIAHITRFDPGPHVRQTGNGTKVVA